MVATMRRRALNAFDAVDQGRKVSEAAKSPLLQIVKSLARPGGTSLDLLNRIYLRHPDSSPRDYQDIRPLPCQ